MTAERFFIVTPGRCGSSLLAAILAAAGARFGMPAASSWHPSNGAMEHPEFQVATDLLAKAHELSDTKPSDPIRRAYWSFYRHRAKKHLARSLVLAHFVKSVNADLSLQMAIGLGYVPRVIVSYRRPEAQIASQFARTKYWTVGYLSERYCRVMRNGIGAARILGGCVVSYDDLHDPTAAAWADALSQLTGLAAEDLLNHRAVLMHSAGPDTEASSLSPEAEWLWSQAEELRGKALNPTRPALRANGSPRIPPMIGAADAQVSVLRGR